MTKKQVEAAIGQARRLHEWQAAGCPPSLEFVAGQDRELGEHLLSTIVGYIALHPPEKQAALAKDLAAKVNA